MQIGIGERISHDYKKILGKKKYIFYFVWLNST